MNNYFKQIWYELRHQRMVTITSILGTAFAIFCVMAVFMISSLKSVPVAPETCRPNLLVGKFIHIEKSAGQSGAGGMSYNTASKFYKDLDGIDIISYCDSWNQFMDATVKDGDGISVLCKNVDDNFWKIFDFKFIAGKPFDKAAVDSDLKEIIIQKSIATQLFGTTDVVGQQISLNYLPYIVRGVVDDTSPLMTESFANVYTPYNPEKGPAWLDGYGGNTMVYLLMSPGTKSEDIKSQVKGRYTTLAEILKKEDATLIYHEAPYTTEENSPDIKANDSPHTEAYRRYRYASYLLLLILPAINLSSMTRSRLRQRVSEIGVRRAYGATKISILGRLLGENLLLTLAGGLIGLVLCVIFLLLFSNAFIYSGGDFGNVANTTSAPTLNMLLNLKSFGLALLLCLLLNLLSTGIPAWKAARINPAEAISGKND